MRKIVFQAADGQHAQLLRMTEDYHRKLFYDCEYHAFYGRPADFFRWDGLFWHFNFVKWYWLRKFMESVPDGTVILWLDSDVIVEKWFDVGSVLNDGSDFGAVMNGFGIFNCGVFFWRVTPATRKALARMIEVGPPIYQPAEDGGAAFPFVSRMNPTVLHRGWNLYSNAAGPLGECVIRAWHVLPFEQRLRGMRKRLEELCAS